MYFISTIKYDKIQENGVVKPVKEQYLFDALSFVEAETRTIEELTPYISGDFSVDAIKKTKIAELFNADGQADRWYKVKVAFITIDERTAQEKKSLSTILVHADDFGQAYERFNDGMRGTLADFEIAGITETAILDYFPVKACTKQE